MTPDDPVRVLILTSDAGSGHRSAANALAGALAARYAADCRVHIANPLHEPNAPPVLRVAESHYLDQVAIVPTFYQFQYELSDGPLSAALMGFGSQLFLRRAMMRLLRAERPHVVVSVYLLYGDAVAAARAKLGWDIPHVTVVTEVGTTVHATWFNPYDALCFVPNSVVQAKALQCGVDDKHVMVTGIPVDQRFARDPLGRAEAREILGWDPALPAVLLMSGGAGIGTMEEMAVAVDQARLPAQLVIIAGRNVELEERLRARRWAGSTHVYGFADNVPDLMRASDIILTKAGGLSISEALAAGLPIILHSAIWGQETGNVSFVLDNGAGVWAPNPADIVRALQRWLLAAPEELQRHTAAARRLGRPRAADVIARQVYRLGLQRQQQTQTGHNAGPP